MSFSIYELVTIFFSITHDSLISTSLNTIRLQRLQLRNCTKIIAESSQICRRQQYTTPNTRLLSCTDFKRQKYFFHGSRLEQTEFSLGHRLLYEDLNLNSDFLFDRKRKLRRRAKGFFKAPRHPYNWHSHILRIRIHMSAIKQYSTYEVYERCMIRSETRASPQ